MAPVRLPVGRKKALSSRYGSYVSFVDRKWTQTRRPTTSGQTGNCLSDDGKRGRVVAPVVEAESDDDDDDTDDVEDGLSSLDDDEEDSNHVIRGDCLANGRLHGNGSWCSTERRRIASKSDSTYRSVCCLTGCRGLLPSLNRRLLRYFAFRRRSKFTMFVSLSLCVTAIKLLTTNVDFRLRPDDNNALADTSSLTNNDEDDGPYRNLTGGRGILAEPDCRALFAGDSRELALTKAMLFREVRPAIFPSDDGGNDDRHAIFPSHDGGDDDRRAILPSDDRGNDGGDDDRNAIFPSDDGGDDDRRAILPSDDGGNNGGDDDRHAIFPSDDGGDDDRRAPSDCSSSLLRQFGFNSTLPPDTRQRLPTRSIAYLVSVDSNSTPEQTATLLGSLHTPVNYICVSISNTSRSRDVLLALRRITSCLHNIRVIVADDITSDVTGRRCVSGSRCACASGGRPEVVAAGGDGGELADCECARAMLSDVRTEWDYLVKLSTFHLPVVTDEVVLGFIERRLVRRSRTRNSTQTSRIQRRCASNVLADIGSLRFTNGCAYSRRTVERLMAKQRCLGNGLLTTLRSDSLGGVTSAGSANDHENQLDEVDISTNKRCSEVESSSPSFSSSPSSSRSACVHTVADLPELARARTPFVDPFDVNTDHFAVRCVLDRRRSRPGSVTKMKDIS